MKFTQKMFDAFNKANLKSINLEENMYGNIYLSIKLKDAKEMDMKTIASIIYADIIIEFGRMQLGLSERKNTIMIIKGMYWVNISNKDFENMTYIELCKWFERHGIYGYEKQ